eukprot:TRINITY_DN23621_c0_g1_i2.p1 TRINITY_DN23621_c0_g1~~TRINITY_DN23621_c0_g1_i2.p1  ORF type:complete len:863 (-),score=278.08 TRINITY_DN23621_c0_g1_i2:218-2806(-)
MAAADLREEGLAATAAAFLEHSTDGLAEHYRKISKDEMNPKEVRDAASCFVKAHDLLEEEDYESALTSAKEAVKCYTDLKDNSSAADSIRLLVQACCLHAASLNLTGRKASKNAGQDSLEAAEQIASKQASEYKSAGDSQGHASMLLALGHAKSCDLLAPQKHAEAEESIKEALRLAKQVADRRLQAVACMLLADLARKAGSATQVYENARAALECYKKIGDAKGEAKAHQLLGTGIVMSGKLEEGAECCLQASRIYRQIGAKKLEAFVYYLLANYFMSRGQGREAAEHACEAALIFKSLGSVNAIHQAFASAALVQANIVKGDQRQALRVAREGFQAFKDSSSLTGRRCEALLLAALASALAAKEDWSEALELAEQVQSRIQDIGDQRWEAAWLRELSAFHVQRKAFDEAAQTASDAVTAAQAAGDRAGEAFGLSSLVEVHIHREDFYAATQVCNEQRAIFQELGKRSHEAACLLVAAQCLSSNGSLDQARGLSDEAAELFQQLGDTLGQAKASRSLAEIFAKQGDSDGAMKMAKEMRAKAKQIGDKLLEAASCKTLANVHQSFDRHVEAVQAANEAVRMAKKAVCKLSLVEMMNLSVQIQVSLILKDGAQSSAHGVEKALRPAKEAVTVAKAAGKKSLICSCLYQLGEVQLMSYKLGQAMASAKEALQIFEGLEDEPGKAGAVILMAETHYAGGRHDKAEEVLKEGLQLAAACSDKGKEQYGNQLSQRIKDARKALEAPVMPQMMPMQMMAMPSAPVAQAAGTAPAASPQAVAEVKEVGLDPAMVQATVQDMAKQAIGVDDELFLDSALMDSGMDSLTAVSFRNGLQQNLGVKLPSSLMFDYPTMKEVANRIVELSVEDA